MSNTESAYKIKYSGLPVGKHKFDFIIHNDFFTDYSNKTEFIDAHINVHVNAERMLSKLILHLFISGKITVECDRCLEPCDINIDTEKKLIFSSEKEGLNNSSNDDINIEISYNTEYIILDGFLYDFIVLSMPLRRVHDELEDNSSACNHQMISILQKLKPNKTKTNLSHWDILKNINPDKKI